MFGGSDQIAATGRDKQLWGMHIVEGLEGGRFAMITWLALNLGAVKAVKNALGGMVNDVVLGTVAGAVRRFLQGRRVNVDALDFRALVPVSVRRDEERGAMGNLVAAWLADLPVAERHPRTRFASLYKTTAGLKESRQPRGPRRNVPWRHVLSGQMLTSRRGRCKSET